MYRLLLTLSITVMAGFTQSQQAPTEKPPLKIRVERVNPRAPLAPEEGDKFEVDPATGDVLIEFKRPDGTLTNGRIEVATNVKPEVDARWELVGSGLVRYSYVLTNHHGAEQHVKTFAVAMASPRLISKIETPPGWRASGVSLAEWGAPSRYNWHSGYYQEGVRPGSQAGPFAFDSPHLPGLTHVYAASRVGAELPASLKGMSEWLDEQVYQKIRYENNTVQPPTIGPVIPIGPNVQAEQVIDGIRSQLMSVVGRRDFREWEPQLTDLMNVVSSGNLTAVLNLRPALAQMGTTALQKAFFGAMAFDLDCLSKMQ